MSEQKAQIGYPTPSKKIQDAFATTQDEILKNLTNWEWLNQRANEIFTKETKKKLDHRDLLAFTIINLIEISRLGIELAEIHERLANVEKLLKELPPKL